MATDPSAPETLAVERRRWTRWLWLPLLVVVLAVAAWWVRNPADLPASDDVVVARVKAGQTVYLGVPVDVRGSRTIEVREVRITATGPADTTVSTALWTCTGGSVSQTTAPEPFCDDWREAEGTSVSLGGGDQLVVAVNASVPGVVEVSRIELDFSDGWQRGSGRIGPRFEVTLLG